MTASPVAITADDGAGRWRWPVVRHRYDASIAIRTAEKQAVDELGADNLRRLRRHDPGALAWGPVSRLLRPLDDVTAVLDSPPTTHRRRAMDDAVAVVLLRYAGLGRSYWGWTTEEWAGVLGRDQPGFREGAPAWADDAVRPYLAAHAYLLGGFSEFHRLGSFGRLALAWRVFGYDRVDAEIRRIRTVLAGWGYQLGRDDDKLLPMVACQVFLLNRSPHVDDLTTSLFDGIRNEQLLTGTRLNTLHAMQKAVAHLGFCDPPAQGAARRAATAAGGPEAWAQWANRWHATSTLTRRVRGSIRSTLLRVGRWIAAEHPGAADPAAWTRQTCAAWIAALDRMNIGDFVPAGRRPHRPHRQAAAGVDEGEPAGVPAVTVSGAVSPKLSRLASGASRPRGAPLADLRAVRRARSLARAFAGPPRVRFRRSRALCLVAPRGLACGRDGQDFSCLPGCSVRGR